MLELLMFILGLVVGAIVCLFVMALLTANKCEESALANYKEGYEKGYNDGCEFNKRNFD